MVLSIPAKSPASPAGCHWKLRLGSGGSCKAPSQLIQPAPSGSGRNLIKSEIIHAHYPLPPTSTGASPSSRLQTQSDNHWHPARPPRQPPQHLITDHRTPSTLQDCHLQCSTAPPFLAARPFPHLHRHTFIIFRSTVLHPRRARFYSQSSIPQLATFLHPQLHLQQYLFSTSSYHSRPVIFHLSSLRSSTSPSLHRHPNHALLLDICPLASHLHLAGAVKGISRRRTPASSPESQISILSINPSDPPWPCLVDCPPPF